MTQEYIMVWAFDVKPEQVRAFEETYGPSGAWANLFRHSPDYAGTELLRANDGSGRYLTIDRWRSAAAYGAFRAAYQKEYDELDRQGEGLTEKEINMGRFERCV